MPLNLLERFAAPGWGHYAIGMSAALRILTLIALAMMPFTMVGAPAEAHTMPSAIAQTHCGEHPDNQAPPAADMAQCMLMCAALPAAEILVATPPEMPKAARLLVLAKPIHGMILEIATPPPRAA